MGLIKRVKNSKKPLMGQIFDLIPSSVIKTSIKAHDSDRYFKTYRTHDQLVALLFGQLNKCLTLRDVVIGLNVSGDFLRDIGLKQSPARSTMSHGHGQRDWQVFESIFKGTFSHYQRLFSRTAHYKSILELEGRVVHIIDSTTISLCLNLFDWATFRTSKGAIKIHTQLDERSEMPVVVHVSEGSLHDKKGVKHLSIEDGSVLIDDRGYYDFEAFVSYIKRDITFVTRIKSNADYKLVCEETLSQQDQQAGVTASQRITMRGGKAFSTTLSDHTLRLITVWDEKNQKELQILSNNLTWPPHVIAELYKRRWKVELFFKALKQNLQVKTFLGTSENAVKSQIYVALLAFVLLEFIRRCLSQAKHAFKQFVNLIRICLMKYQGLNYVVNQVKDQSQSLPRGQPIQTAQLSLFNTI